MSMSGKDIKEVNVTDEMVWDAKVSGTVAGGGAGSFVALLGTLIKSNADTTGYLDDPNYGSTIKGVVFGIYAAAFVVTMLVFRHKYKASVAIAKETAEKTAAADRKWQEALRLQQEAVHHQEENKQQLHRLEQIIETISKVHAESHQPVETKSASSSPAAHDHAGMRDHLKRQNAVQDLSDIKKKLEHEKSLLQTRKKEKEVAVSIAATAEEKEDRADGQPVAPSRFGRFFPHVPTIDKIKKLIHPATKKPVAKYGSVSE